jgi:hypothetical protein
LGQNLFPKNFFGKKAELLKMATQVGRPKFSECGEVNGSFLEFYFARTAL